MSHFNLFISKVPSHPASLNRERHILNFFISKVPFQPPLVCFPLPLTQFGSEMIENANSRFPANS